MISQFFINRPVFAMVISIVITLVDLISLFTLSVDRVVIKSPIFQRPPRVRSR